MKGDSRVQKSLLNAKINTVCFFVSIVVSFFSRKIFLDQLGAAFMGLAGTLNSLLGFLNIAELGISTAIAFVLFKPLSESDENKIREIVSVLGYLYKCIGHFILFAGFLLSLALPWIFADSPFHYSVIYLGYYAYLISALIGYYINYKQVLLSADQRYYEVTGYFQIVGVIMVLAQMACAIYTGSFYIFFCLQLLGGVFFSIILNYRIKKVYPWLQTDVRQGKSLLKQYPAITKMIKQVFVHRISGFVQFELSPFLIYAYVSLPMVAIYSNYSMLTDRLLKLLQGVMDSTTAGVGNLISEGNTEKVWDIYKQLFSLRLFVAGICCSSFFYVVNGFVNLWLGDIYLLSTTTVFLMTVSLFLMIARGTTDQFINGYGLYYDTWAPVTEVVIFILFSVVLGRFYGLNGILVGPILSTLAIVHVWKPIFLFRKGLKRPLLQYVRQLAHDVVLIVVCYAILSKLMSWMGMGVSTWMEWIGFTIVYVVLYVILLFILFFVTSRSFRQIVHTFHEGSFRSSGL